MTPKPSTDPVGKSPCHFNDHDVCIVHGSFAGCSNRQDASAAPPHKCFYRTVERGGQFVTECETCHQPAPPAEGPTQPLRCTHCGEPFTLMSAPSSPAAPAPTEPTDSERSLIEGIASDAIRLAMGRFMLTPDDEEATEDEIVRDICNVLCGDDTGCADPDDPDDDKLIYRHVTAIRKHCAAPAGTKKPCSHETKNKCAKCGNCFACCLCLEEGERRVLKRSVRQAAGELLVSHGYVMQSPDVPIGRVQDLLEEFGKLLIHGGKS